MAEVPDIVKLADAVDPRFALSTYIFHHGKAILAPLAWCLQTTQALCLYVCCHALCLLCCLIPGVDCVMCMCLAGAADILVLCCCLGVFNSFRIAEIPDPTNFFQWIHAVEKNYGKGQKKAKKAKSASSAPKEHHSSSSSSSSDDDVVNRNEEIQNEV